MLAIMSTRILVLAVALALTSSVAALLLGTPAHASARKDRNEVRVMLRELGAERIRVWCDHNPEPRACAARYVYVNRAALRVGLSHLAVQRCSARFSVSHAIEYIGAGYYVDLTISQDPERCNATTATRDGLQGARMQSRTSLRPPFRSG